MNITVGQILAFIGGLAGLIGSMTVIITFLNKVYTKTVKKEIQGAITPLKDDVECLRNEMHTELEKSRNEFRATADNLDASECRNFLVRFLGDIERGVDIDPVEVERAYDIMQHYSEDLGQNSYIHARWEQVMGNRSLASSIKKYTKSSKK